MRQLLLAILFLLNLISLNAQKKSGASIPTLSPEDCTIAFYSQDSVAMRMKGFKPLFDTLTAMNKRLSDLQNQSFVATDKLLILTPDSGQVLTAAETKELDAATKQVTEINLRIEFANKSIADFRQKNLVPFYQQIAKIADTVCREKGIKQYFETFSEPPLQCPTDQTLMIDITRDIGMHMGIRMHSFRIGIINMDSLLRLIPGYAIRADSTIREIRELDSLRNLKDVVIEQKQHELDSLRPTLSGRKIKTREQEIQQLKDERDEFYGWRLYNIDKRHESRVQPYTDRLNMALQQAQSESGCTAYFDRNANIPWTDKEAEFYDMNIDVVKFLKL